MSRSMKMRSEARNATRPATSHQRERKLGEVFTTIRPSA